MSRPTDWYPLDLPRDPVVGDPDAVREEARYYDGVADDIQAQVDRLRRISSQEGLNGDYSEVLRDSCEDLADHLGKAKGRFETTSEQLFKLAPALETALSETEAALADAIAAKEADAKEAAESDDPAPRYPSMTDSEGVRQAKNRLEDALDQWDSAAKPIADAIRDGAEDSMKDGRFEALKAWVKEHAELLRKISEILGAIVLVLAVAIFIISNPAGWLVGLAILAGALLLAVDSLLAVAGEGSWGAVALDVLGLATLGLGSLVGKLAQGARSLSILKGTNLAGLRGFAAGLKSAFNGNGALSRIITAFKPGTWSSAWRSGSSAADDIARALKGLPIPNAYKASQLVDDLADITRIINPTNPALIHVGSVGLTDLLGNLGNLATIGAFATHPWLDPEGDGLGALLSDHTTYEIPTQTW